MLKKMELENSVGHPPGHKMTITSTSVPRAVFNRGYFFNDVGGAGRSVHFSQDFLPTLYKSMIKIKIHP